MIVNAKLWGGQALTAPTVTSYTYIYLFSAAVLDSNELNEFKLQSNLTLQ